MAKEGICSLTLAVSILLMVFDSAACGYNHPDVNYTCDESGVHLKMTFDRPFKGLLYVKGHSSDHNCRSPSLVHSLEASLDIPLLACDTYVNYSFPGLRPFLRGIIVVQQHPLLPTDYDSTEPFFCLVQSKERRNWNDVLEKARYALSDSPQVDYSLDFGLGSEVLGGKKAKELDLANSKLLRFKLHEQRTFKDMLITDCIMHNESFIGPTTLVFQMTGLSRCANTSTQTSTSFTMRNNKGVLKGAYLKMDLFHPVSTVAPLITCAAFLCKDECKCSNDGRQGDHQIIDTLRLSYRFKRSATDETTEASSINHYRTRSRLLRSTVKALSERLLRNVRRTRHQMDETNFERRALPFENETITVDPTPTDITFTKQLPITDSDLYYNIDGHEMELINMTHVDNSTGLIPELEVEEIMPTLAVLLMTSTTSDLDLNDTGKKLIRHERNKVFTSVKVKTKIVGLKRDDLSNNFPTFFKVRRLCFSKTLFVVFITVLLFILLCLLLVICGGALYISKEKKRNSIDSYRLYNYF